MNDIKLAILRTFESTVKALLGSGQNDVQCVFDANADVGQVCDHLRNELSDVKARLQQLELKSGLHKISNVIINEWPEDIEEDNAFRRSFLSSIPIPLARDPVVAPTVNAVSVAVIAENAVIAVPTTPELAPRAVETCEHIPDIIDTMHMDLDIVEIKSEVVIKDVVHVVDDEVEEVEEEEEEEEEEGLEEIEYNGNTYYKDSENLVYTLNDDGELNEKSVGRWNDVTNVVRFFAKSAVTK